MSDLPGPFLSSPFTLDRSYAGMDVLVMRDCAECDIRIGGESITVRDPEQLKEYAQLMLDAAKAMKEGKKRKR